MRSVELFAGAGGLGLGVENAGFEHAAVIERDADACDAIRRNMTTLFRGKHAWPLIQGDVTKLDFNQYAGKVDLVSGGPPCQPFSIGGKHRGHSDARDMFPQAARAIREIQPRAFIFENVRGLLRESFSKYLEYIRLQLTYPELSAKTAESWESHLARLEQHHTKGNYRGLLYRVLIQPVNAADYGIPQKRKRVFIVGFRSDVGEKWNFPQPTHSEDALLVSKWVTGEYWERNKIAKKQRPLLGERLQSRMSELQDSMPFEKAWRTVRDVIGSLPEPTGKEATCIGNHRLQDGAKSYPGHTGSPLDEPAKTLKAGDHGVPGGENMLLMPDGRVRYFTVRESARLQTFPDWYHFPSSWTESMRQIGNAVPVQLAEIIAKSVAEALIRHEKKLAALS